MPLTLEEHRHMRSEYQSLKVLSAKTGEDLRTLIDVPEGLRSEFHRYARHYPTEAHIVNHAMAYRDEMLDLLEKDGL